MLTTEPTSSPVSNSTRQPSRSLVRGCLVGLTGVIVINLLTPFNNYVVSNTDLIGSHLPVGLLLFFVAVILLINAPLSRWRPSWRLSRREMGLALGMVLVGCAVPSVGLMRYLPGHLAAFWHHSTTDRDAGQLMSQLHLPDWLFPTFETTAPADRGSESVARDFFLAGGVKDRSLAGRLAAVPWSAWLIPAISWGVFLAGLWGSLLCIAAIMRQQWEENERLPFPLATVYLALIEPPPPGRAFNELMQARSFWIAAASVFAAHLLAGLHVYLPQYVPHLELKWDFNSLLADPPWAYTSWTFKRSSIYFTIIGLTYFVRSNVTFSLWFMFLLLQVARMVVMSYGGEITAGMQDDQLTGAILTMGIVVLVASRHHLTTVVRQMFAGGSYRTIGWTFVLCVATSVAWLVAAGTSVIGAVVIIGLLLITSIVIMRTIGETGLLYLVLPMPLTRPWLIMGQELPSVLAARTTPRSFFFSAFFQGALAHDTRESLAGFAPNAMQVADAEEPDGGRPAAGRWRVMACMVLALAVAYVVGGGATLWAHYNYAQTLATPPESPVGWWGSLQMPKAYAIEKTQDYLNRPGGSAEGHSRIKHVALGATVTSVLAVLRVRVNGCPFDPIGYLLMYTWGIGEIWFSLLLGWLLKSLLLKVGGSKLYYASKPFFIGMIMGESMAVGFWLLVSFVRAMNGLEYHTIQLLPA